MTTPITATFPALNFPKEVDYPTQEDWAAFSAAAELNYGILSGAWSDKSEEFKEQTNNLALEIQAIGENAINAITLDTVDDLATYTGTGLVMVKDLNRGGTFIYDATQSAVNNGGTIFNGWVRQFSGAVNVKWFGAKGDGVTDDTLAIRSALSLLSPLIIEETKYFYAVSDSLAFNDITYIDIVGVGLPKIKLINTPSVVSNSHNSILRVNSLSTKISIRNLHLIGNFDGNTSITYSTGVGIWLTPTENCVPYIDNVKCDYFTSYGIYFYTNSAVAGTLYADSNRYQGVAIVNVRDNLTIDTIITKNNLAFGVDIEYSTSRPIGLNNIIINNFISDGDSSGINVNSGMATDAILSGHGIDATYFNAIINNIECYNNSAFGVLIDFPTCKIGAIQVKNCAGVATIIRGAYSVTRYDVAIDSLTIVKSVEGLKLTSMITYPYRNISIGSATILESSTQGVLTYPEGFCTLVNIDSLYDITSSPTAISSQLSPETVVKRGKPYFTAGAPAQFNMETQRKYIEIPPTLGVNTFFTLGGSTSYITNIYVVITVADPLNPRLRLRINSNIKADIRLGTIGTRVLSLMSNTLQGVDTNIAPIGLDLNGAIRLDPVDTIPYGGSVRGYLLVDYITIK